MSRVHQFFRRHPILKQTLLWSVPALIFGAVLRLMMMSYMPYGFWGSDSRGYYEFADRLLGDGKFVLSAKRRYLYPILMLPVSVLPGSPLKWTAWLQHLLGLLSILPLTYVMRKTLRFWRWWVVPVGAAYVVIPVFLWQEQEMIGDVVFFATLAWAYAGWMAWTKEPDPARARRLFWWFFVPLAGFMLTRPAGRFAVPGLACGLLIVRAWRVLDWRRWTAMAVLCAVTLTVGDKRHGAWLFYLATFPLTQLDTPANADYKAEIRPYLEPYIRDIDKYYLREHEAHAPDHPDPFDFLDNPSVKRDLPLWSALQQDDAKKSALYMALGMEALKAHPGGFLYLGAQRLVASANISRFDVERLGSTFYPERMKGIYEGAQESIAQGKAPALARAYGFPKMAPLPPFEEFRKKLTPTPGCWAEQTLLGIGRWVCSVSDVVVMPNPKRNAPPQAWSIANARLTAFGWWVVASLALAFCYWRTLGVWVLVAASYLAGVYLVTLVHPRYFAPAWLIFLPILAVPLDVLPSLFIRKKTT